MRSLTVSRPCLVALATAAAIAVGIPATGAEAATLSGVEASGRIDAQFRICSTCNVEIDAMYSAETGGTGSTGPAVVDGYEVAGNDPQGYGSVRARASLAGPAATPSLSAYAAAQPGVGPRAGYSEPGAYLFAAIAEAQAAQHYTYVGTSAATYDLTFTLTGSAVNLGTAYDNLISVIGSLLLYDADPSYGLEAPYGLPVDSDWLDFSASTAGADGYLGSRTVSISLDPGDSFYAVARLAAYVGPNASGIADASHTLRMAFTAGDVDLLEAALQPTTQSVPEPGAAALMLLGLAALGSSARRRRARMGTGCHRPRPRLPCWSANPR